MPRGVAIPEIRQQLFAAAERVMVRDGPDRLSGRAVTTEAGVAAGLLYAHFQDLDDFLTAYAVDRSFLVSADAAALEGRIGSGTIAGNLCDAVLSIPLPTVQTLTRLLVSRPHLTAQISAVLGEQTAGLDAIERAATGYLAEEQRLGRLAKAAEPDALALALVGVVQHLVLHHTAEPESSVRARIRRTVTALVDSCTTQAPTAARSPRRPSRR